MKTKEKKSSKTQQEIIKKFTIKNLERIEIKKEVTAIHFPSKTIKKITYIPIKKNQKNQRISFNAN